MKRSRRLILLAAIMAVAAHAAAITLSGPGLALTFDDTGQRLSLLQMQRAGAAPLLYADREGAQAGAGPVGNPLAVVIREGRFQGMYGVKTFRVTGLQNTDRRLLVYLQHDSMPLALALEITVEGNVATWLGQAFWNGDEPVELDIYLPLLSRVRFANVRGPAQGDRRRQRFHGRGERFHHRPRARRHVV